MIFNTTNYPLLPIESTDLFQFEVQTTSSTGNLVVLPTRSGITGYNYYVNWGDGSAVEYSTTNASKSHTYSSYNTYKITIKGSFPTFNIYGPNYFPENENTNFRLQLKRIISFGNNIFKRFTVRDCENLISLPKVITRSPFRPYQGTDNYSESLEYIFANTGITKVPANLFKINSGYLLQGSVRGMFQDCTNLTTIPDDLFNDIKSYGQAPYQSSIQNVSYAFYNTALTSIPSTLFSNLPNLTNCEATFKNTNITSIPSTLFNNNPNITTFKETFRGSLITSVPSGLFTNNTDVTNFSYTFDSCFDLTTIPSTLFSTCVAATDFSKTFKNCHDLLEVPNYLFRYNLQAQTFSETFSGCIRAKLNQNIFSTDTEYTTRFNNMTTETEYAFYRTFWLEWGTYAGSTTNAGAVPNLWDYEDLDMPLFPAPAGGTFGYLPTLQGDDEDWGHHYRTNKDDIPDRWKNYGS